MAGQVVLSICLAGMNEVIKTPRKKEQKDIGNLRQRRKMIVAGETWLEQHSRATEAFGSSNNT